MLTIVLFTMHHLEKLRSQGLRTRDGHILEALDRHPEVGRILVIDRPATRAERILRRRSGSGRMASVPAELGLTKTEYVCSENTAAVRPALLRSRWWLHAYERAHLTFDSSRSIGSALATADVGLCFVPTAHRLWAGRVPTVFDLLDNWLIHPQLGQPCRNSYEAEYRASFDNAAWVTANAEGTADLAISFGRDPVLLTNGVDREAFQRRARRSAARWRQELQSLPRPWLVYVGKMQQRIDVELLISLQRLALGTLILAGPVLDRRWMRPLRRAGGVAWLGDVPYDDIPGLLAVADVGLIPHRGGHGEVGGDPLKAHEYAAVGTRFVSTAIGGAQRIAAKGLVAPSRDAFVHAVVALGRDERSVEERLASAAASLTDSWDAKAETIVRLVAGGPSAAAPRVHGVRHLSVEASG
jgi:glycosyltransferase involved in cell wall biosynthesis